MPNEVETLRKMPAKRRIEAIETPAGEWLAAGSDDPNLMGSGPTFEDAAIDLFTQAEQIGERSTRDQ